MPGLLAASDILCHPSLAEGLPNAIVEAMASGVPVVASDVGGTPEVVSHEDTGLLVPPHDIKAIAASLHRLLDCSAARAAAGREGRGTPRASGSTSGGTSSTSSHASSRSAAASLAAYATERPDRARPRQVPIDVLFLMNALRVGGEETELQLLARHLDRATIPPPRRQSVSVRRADDPWRGCARPDWRSTRAVTGWGRTTRSRICAP